MCNQRANFYRAASLDNQVDGSSSALIFKLNKINWLAAATSFLKLIAYRNRVMSWRGRSVVMLALFDLVVSYVTNNEWLWTQG